MKKFHFIKQHDSMQCGIACLAMICAFYKKKYSLNTLSQICHATTEGTSLLGLFEAATALGLSASTRTATVEQLIDSPHPSILHWNQNHFVVLYQVKNNTFYIADPSKGLVSYSPSEFQDHWTNTDTKGGVGIVMFIQPTKNFGKFIEQHNTDNRIHQIIFSYIKKHGKYLTQIILGLFISCILQLLMPFLTQAIVDIGIKNSNISFIWLILFGELVIVSARTATDFIRRWLLLHISMRVNIELISNFFLKLLELPMSFFDTKLLGDILQRMGDYNRIQSFLTQQVLNAIFTFLSFFVFGLILCFYNKTIFGCFLLGSLVYGGWIALFLRKRKIIDYEIFEKQSINQDRTFQFITSMQEIKLQSCEQRRRWEWEDIQADLFITQMKSLKLQQSQETGSIFINEVKNIIITVIAATAVINGEMTLGMMLAIQYIIGQLNSPIEQFMGLIHSVQDVKLSLERINDIYRIKEENSSSNRLTEFKNSKTILLDSVDFKYSPHDITKVLSNISFSIPEGKVTAIVGASGSGKTTLIKLLLGYYPATTGNIIIAGENISNYNLKWWRKQCGVVMQDGVIFSESIAKNIAIDDNDVDFERLKEAAQIANIHSYIMKLPLAYNTRIGKDGIGLSQGQKQRILIARAIYKNPSFIFLDEATNALDSTNEKEIVENLKKIYQGRTVIIIAHRLSTVKNADQIIVLEEGKITEVGSHNSLIEKQGAYYLLIKNQLELNN